MRPTLRLLLAAGAMLGTLAAPAQPARVLPLLPATIELRYCHAAADVPRAADGSIKRSSAASGAFRRVHPCPATGAREGACPGWQIDHIIPLACAGRGDHALRGWQGSVWGDGSALQRHCHAEHHNGRGGNSQAADYFDRD